MKKILLYIGIAIAAIGCTKDDATTTLPSDGEISFVAGVTTRVSADNDLAWEATDVIGISTDQTGESNMKFTVIDTASGALKNESGVYLDANAGSRTYYAYYPYSEVVTDNKVSFDFSTDQSTPILFAKTDVATSSDEVELTFSHKLAKVTFNLTAGGVDVTSLEGAEVWLTGAYATGKFDTFTGYFSSQATGKIDLELDENSGSVTAYMIPMSNPSGVKLWITVGGNTYVNSLVTEMWESGKKYEYDITVGEKSDSNNDPQP